MIQHDQAKLLAIVDRIYAASVNDDWHAVMAAIAEHFDHIPVQLFGHDFVLGKAEYMVVLNHGEEQLKSYAEHYHAINPWLPGIIGSPVGQVRRTEDYLPEEQLVKTEFYNDWIRPHDDIRRGCGVTLFNTESRTLMLGANLRTKDQEGRADELRDFMEIILPHFYRALEIQHGLRGAQSHGAHYRQALDEVGNAVFLLDRQGHICDQNEVADALARRGDLFTRTLSGALGTFDPDADREISAGLAAIVHDRLAYHRCAFGLRSRDRSRTYLAMVAPLEQVHEELTISELYVGSRLPAAMLIVASPDYGRATVSRSLQGLYQLTAAEARLAEAVYQGHSLADFAEANAVSIHTVRNQLKAIFQKTDTSRQGEVVALVANLVRIAGR